MDIVEKFSLLMLVLVYMIIVMLIVVYEVTECRCKHLFMPTAVCWLSDVAVSEAYACFGGIVMRSSISCRSFCVTKFLLQIASCC